MKQTEPAMIPDPHKPMNTWKHMVAHACILFLVIALVMVYFTATGSPQAGLIEVGVSAFIFVALFHLIMKYFPSVSKIITSVIVIGFGIALVFVNFHYLKLVKQDASLKQLLVGDLLVKKIVKTIKNEPIAIVSKEEIPKIVSEQKQEKPSPAMSLDQLKTSIAGPIISDMNLEVLHVTSLKPATKAETLSITKEDTVGSSLNVMPKEISLLPLTVKECEPTIQDVIEKTDVLHTLLLGTIQDAPIAMLKEQAIQPSAEEKAEAIPVR